MPVKSVAGRGLGILAPEIQDHVPERALTRPGAAGAAQAIHDQHDRATGQTSEVEFEHRFPGVGGRAAKNRRTLRDWRK